MKLTVIPAILATCGAAAAAAVARTPGSDAHARPSDPLSARGHRIPTAHESAVMGRRILALSPLGTLSTVFPEDKESGSGSGSGPGAAERRPSGLGGVPLGLVDYVADCEDEGNPTILAVDIATHFRNVRAGSNISLAVRWARRTRRPSASPPPPRPRLPPRFWAVSWTTSSRAKETPTTPTTTTTNQSPTLPPTSRVSP